ncbi:FecR domain-containing protein [Peteryoungia ipomoeae]|uniref:FecR protein domain-containing protein n=1 Tax=Peteryoungia ipomoeae TaxID=1210932 RepID=A0A4S8P245_9HYPH|nr:FecR domain-containing protein [Peteryoungia ipomoeae]THV23381.1 hypothetical protein FAA97_12350 [Peteryoungia ipomoeae]
MQSVLKIALTLLFLILQSALAAAQGEWSVANAGKQVMVTMDNQTWSPLRKGDAVPNGAWISTGPVGRAQLVRGKESVTFKPNTLASVTTRGFFFRKTDVLQQSGELELQIEKRLRPHTSVQTPFLAAVVKGTRFTVSVSRRDARVNVNEGLVEVTSVSSGERSNLKPGQSARVGTGGMQVAGKTDTPSISRVDPPAQRVPAVGQTLKDLNKNLPDAAGNRNTSASSKGAGNSANSSGSSNGKGNSASSGGSSNGKGNSASSGGSSNGKGNSASSGGSSNGNGNSASSGGGSNGKGSSASSGGGSNGKGSSASGGGSSNGGDKGKGRGREK